MEPADRILVLRRARRRRSVARVAALLFVAFALGRPAPAAVPAPPAALPPAAEGGKVFLTPDEALKLAFPKAAIAKETLYLSEEDEARAQKLAGHEFVGRVVRPYVARDGEGALLGTAYFDTHVVRSKKETLMVVVGADDRVARIEVLAFAEPLEYLPRGAFYAQFQKRTLDDELELGRAIRGVSGATLTARATTRAVRQTLALHQVAAEIRAREEERRREEGETQRSGAPGAEPARR